MQVVFIQPYFTFADVFSDTLPSYLARKGHNVEVIGYAGNNRNICSFLNTEQVFYRYVNAISPSIKNYFVEYPYFLGLNRILDEIQPDILHINNLVFLTTYQSVEIAKRLHIKSIVHVHGVMAERGYFLNKLQQVFLYLFGRVIFRDATKIICLTKRDAEEICSYGCPTSKIVVIPNGVDVNTFKPDYEKEDEGLILWLGRFVPEKGLPYLLEAVTHVQHDPRAKNLKLLLVGDGPIKSKINRLAKKYGLEKMVFITKKIRHDAVPDYLNNASLIVLPSLREGLPLVLLEAMACGKPVIGSDISGINDVISHGINGYLVQPRNPKAIANAILSLLENEALRRKLGINARQLMVEKYSWEIISEKIQQVYHEAMIK